MVSNLHSVMVGKFWRFCQTTMITLEAFKIVARDEVETSTISWVGVVINQEEIEKKVNI